MARRMAGVAAAAEETREQIEGVVAAAGCFAFAVLFDAIMAVLVVDFAQFAGG